MRQPHELAPGAPRRAERRAERQLDGDCGTAEHAAERRQERHVADERRGAVARAVGALVADRDRLHRDAGVDRRLEERRVEPSDGGAVGRRPLGEDDDALARAQRRGDHVLHTRGVADAATTQEDRAEAARDAARQRPRRHLGLRDVGAPASAFSA